MSSWVHKSPWGRLGAILKSERAQGAILAGCAQLEHLHPHGHSQPRCSSRRRLGGSSVPLFQSREQSRAGLLHPGASRPPRAVVQPLPGAAPTQRLLQLACRVDRPVAIDRSRHSAGSAAGADAAAGGTLLPCLDREEGKATLRTAIRRFETAILPETSEGEIPGAMHPTRPTLLCTPVV